MRLLLPAIALSVVAVAQSPDPATAAIVERAGRYVDAYLEAFSAVVSEVHQVQKLSARTAG